MQDYKLANGVSQVFTDDGVNGLGRLATAKTKAPSGTDLANRAYSYDPLGNIMLIDSQVAEELDSTYTYDSYGRLYNAKTGGQSYIYELDAADNRKSVTVNGGAPVTYAIADRNKLTAVGSDTYTYDAQGNLTGQTAGADTLQYIYDTEGRLHTVKENGVVVASYSYDASGNRVKSVEGGETVHYVYDGLNVIQENRPTSGSRTDYIFGFGRQLARVDNATANTTYVTGDHLGSSSILTNAAGAVVGRYSYDPYGQILTDTTGAVGQAYKYTGKPLSSTTGLYYYGARWYDPAVGRFTSQDPARDGGNWYAYCYGNPVVFVDPSGMVAVERERKAKQKLLHVLSAQYWSHMEMQSKHQI